MPVVGVIFINNFTRKPIIQLGSFPDWQIALERCFTEFFQNINAIDITHDPFPLEEWEFNQNKFYQLLYNGSNYKEINIFNINFFNNLQKKSHFSNIYIKNKNNFDIIEYYKTLLKQHNINLYYYDNSLIPEIKAIHLFSDNFIFSKIYYNIFKELNNIQKNKVFNLLDKYYNYSKNNSFTQNFFNELYKLNEIELNLFFNLVGRDLFYPYPIKKAFSIFLIDAFYNLDFLRIKKILQQTNENKRYFLHPSIKQYLFIKENLEQNQNIKTIIEVGKIFNFNIVEEDCLNIDVPEYNINKYIIEPFFKEIKSDKYQKFIQTFQKSIDL